MNAIPDLADARQGKAVTVKEKADTVRAALERMKDQLSMALPKHLTADRMLRVVMTAVQLNPKLLDCDRRSLFSAVMTCAQLGLEPDGVLGQAYLVPFYTRDGMKVQFIPGYKGLLLLARNSGEITSVQAHEVHEKDHFEFAYGLDEKLEHRPASGDRGAVTHFYAYAKFKDGGHIFEVMTRADVEKVRDGSEGWKAFKAGRVKTTPWNDHFVQMGRKTVIRRLSNYLPLNVQRAAAIEDHADAGMPAAISDTGDLVVDYSEAAQLEDHSEAGDEEEQVETESKPEPRQEAKPATRKPAARKADPAPKEETKPAPKAEEKPKEEMPEVPAFLNRTAKKEEPAPEPESDDGSDSEPWQEAFIDDFSMHLAECDTPKEVEALVAENAARINALSPPWDKIAADRIKGRRNSFVTEKPAEKPAPSDNFFDGDE